MNRNFEVELTTLCMIRNQKNEILVQERQKKDWPGWTFPGGHVEKNEGMETAMVRELLEETGCGKSAKDEFIQGIGNQNAQESGVWDFSMSISDMKFSQEDGAQTNPMIGMLITQIKDASLFGKIQVDAKKEKAFNLEMKLKAMGMDVPISLVGSLDNEGKEPKLYLATDMMEYIVAVADSMTDGAIDSSQLDTEKLKGKYIDLLAMNEESTKEWQDTIKEYQESEKERKQSAKEYKEFLEGLDKDTFEKKGDTITHTFTKKELQKLIKITTETSEKGKEQDPFEKVKDVSAKVSVNTKENKTNMLINVKPQQDKNVDMGLESLSSKISITQKAKKASISMPKKENILSEQEVEKIFSDSTSMTGLSTEDTTVAINQ